MTARRAARWRLVAAGAAAVALAVGGLVLVTRDRRAQPAAHVAVDDLALRAALDGLWVQAVGDVDDATGPIPGPDWFGVGFQGEAGGPLTLVAPCGTFLSRGYQIVDGRLVLAEPLTSTEAGCPSATLNEGTTRLIDALSGRPRLTVEGDRLTLDGGFVFTRRAEPPSEAAPHPLTTVAPPTAAAPASPTGAPTNRAARTPSLDDLAGRQYQGAGPVAPVRLRLEADGSFGASYGCNGGQGQATVADGRLVVTELSRTGMACTQPGFEEQDDAVVAMLRAGPTIVLDGTTLVLTGATLTLWLAEQFPAPLVGTRWVTNGFVTPQGFGFNGLKQTLELRGDGSWTYEGCTGMLEGRYAIDGSTIAFTTSTPNDPPPCGSNPSQVTEEQNLVALLKGSASYEVVENHLRLTGPNGNGERFVAAP